MYYFITSPSVCCSGVVYKVITYFIFRPYVFKTVVLEQVCEELVRLGAYGVGKVVMRTAEPLR